MDPSRAARGQDSRNDLVDNARAACTLVTSTWADGSKGPLVHVFPEGAITQKVRDKYNNRYAGRHYIMCSGGPSHFMTANSTIIMYNEAFKPAVRVQRAKYGLAHSARAGLTADAFSGNLAFRKGEDLRRQQFAKEANMALPLPPPGGWSAAGQPCDAFHSLLRKYQDRYMYVNMFIFR